MQPVSDTNWINCAIVRFSSRMTIPCVSRCSSSAQAACLLDVGKASLWGRLAGSGSRRPWWATLSPRLSGRLRVVQPLRSKLDTVMHLDSSSGMSPTACSSPQRTLSSSAASSPRRLGTWRGSLAFSSPMRARLAGRKSFSAGPFGREQLTKAYENLWLKDVEEVLKFAICPEGWVRAPRKQGSWQFALLCLKGGQGL